MDIFNKITLNPEPGVTLVRQLKQQITWLVATGELQPGVQLPPVQEMAKKLGINLHTVRGAYRELAAEGLVETRQGRGTHVLPFDLARISQAAGAQRSHTIGVIIPSWSNPFYHDLLQGVEEVAETEQALLFLCNTHDNPKTALRDFARLAAKQVDGILVAAYDICRAIQPGAQANPLPFVTIDWPGCAGYAVQIDLKQAGYLATRHLIQHGHRRVGLITNLVGLANVTPLNDGYAQALLEQGLAPDPALVARVSGFDMRSGAEGARKLLALKNPPTAIFAAADLLALGAMQAARQAGLRIPEHLAVVGFNNIPTAALVEPPLTTVAAPSVQAGREAMKMLQVIIAGEKPPQKQMTLPTSLVLRESCGCPRKEG